MVCSGLTLRCSWLLRAGYGAPLERSRRVEVEHDDPAPLGPDPAQLSHRAQRAGDGGARGGRPATEIGLGDRQADLDPLGGGIAVALGELEQARGDAADGVLARELDALAVGVAKAAPEHVDQGQRRRRAPLQVGAKLGRRKCLGDDRLDRGDAARPRFLVRERQLAEDVARAAEAEHDLAPIRVKEARLDVPFEHDHNAVARLALVHQARPGREAAPAAQPQQLVAVAIVEQREEGAGLSRSGLHNQPRC
jgi:hypothetical protein